MKKLVFAPFLLALVILAGAFNLSLTTASATIARANCEPTNPPPQESSCGGGWEFWGCFSDSKGQVFEVYYLINCQSSINRPAN